MKIKEGFVLRPLGQEFIVVGEGVQRIDFNKMLTLNATAAYLWRSVEGREFSVDELRQLLLDRYEVPEDVAGKDAAAVAAKWVREGVASE